MIVGAILAASTGVVGATVVTMGLISLPAMLRAGYDKRLACGAICASGTLAQIIPPSTVLILVADILTGVNQEAQLELGNFSPRPVSVGDLFAGALLPGLLLVLLYLAFVAWTAWRNPERAPALPMSAAERRELPGRLLVSLLAPLLLILAVLGSILAGIATATESASLGAVAVLAFAALRGRLSSTPDPRGRPRHRQHDLDDLRPPAWCLDLLARLPRPGGEGWSRTRCAPPPAGRSAPC